MVGVGNVRLDVMTKSDEIHSSYNSMNKHHQIDTTQTPRQCTDRHHLHCVNSGSYKTLKHPIEDVKAPQKLFFCGTCP